MDIVNSLKKIRSEIPESVKIIAVSKTKSIATILVAYASGQKVFGENKVQELVEKHLSLPEDIEWHFIGHLQTNKVKYLAPFVDLIHAVDSMKLLREINKQANKNNRVISCLLQVHIAEEETKFGMSEEELFTLMDSISSEDLPNVNICGLMGMATYTTDEDQIRKEFRNLRELFERVLSKYNNKAPNFSEISMGMSDDYNIAVKEGSTMVRIGSLIFGARG